MREIKFRAWNNELKIMHKVGDDYGTTHELDCVNYFKQGQPVALLQYTGLKDVNGVEIYEGDIIEHYVTAWNTGGYGDWKREVVNIRSLPMDKSKVIGNIYENPELLEN